MECRARIRLSAIVFVALQALMPYNHYPPLRTQATTARQHDARLQPVQPLLLLVLFGVLIILAEDSKAIEQPEPSGKLLWPLERSDFVCLSLAIPALIIAAKGGVGGGGMLVPLYSMVLGFDTRRAIALTNVTILGGAIANVVVAGTKTHPKRNRPLIDWTLITVMEPLAVAGAIVGTILNPVLPSLVLSCLYVLLFAYLAHRTIVRALHWMQRLGGWRQLCCCVPVGDGEDDESRVPINVSSDSLDESQDDQSDGVAGPHSYGALAQDDGDSGGRRSANNGNSGDGGRAVGGWAGVRAMARVIALHHKTAVKRMLAEEGRAPTWQPMALALCFLGVVALQLLRGELPCASPQYWMAAVGALAYVITFFFFFRWGVLKEYKKKTQVGYPFLPTDVRWDSGNSLRWPLICSMAGLIAGLFGSGGGTVKGPLLLEMGVSPVVASATVATMILFTSASASLGFSLLHLLPMDYALACFALGLFTTAFVAIACYEIREQHERRRQQALVVLSMGLCLALSALAMGYKTLTDALSGQGVAFGTLCSHETRPLLFTRHARPV